MYITTNTMWNKIHDTTTSTCPATEFHRKRGRGEERKRGRVAGGCHPAHPATSHPAASHQNWLVYAWFWLISGGWVAGWLVAGWLAVTGKRGRGEESKRGIEEG